MDSAEAGEKTSKMWLELGERIAASLSEILAAEGDPEKAIRWATCAEACFWQSTGDADTHDVKDVLGERQKAN